LTKVNVNLGENYDKDLITVILTDVGGAIAEKSLKDKIQKAINADSLTISVSNGIRDGLIAYFYINTVNSIDENPQYISEVRLEKLRITSTTSGIYTTINTRAIITDRGTAKTVWENTESANIPIGDVIFDFTNNKYISTAKGVINAVRLMQMSEEELRAAINIAAGEAGKRQCDQLREDIANND